METVGAIVVGAGVVGIAIARALALGGRETLLLEGESHFGTGTSARNSEVIHAGIYYPGNSLKARFCVDGRKRLYRYCEERGVLHKRTGKIVFAASADQSEVLDGIASAGREAGVKDLVRLSRAQVAALEPALDCHEALLSPSTGIVDSHAFMTAMLGDLASADGMLVCNSSVDQITRRDGRWLVHLRGEHDAAVASALLVNAAGLGAQALAARIEELPPDQTPPLHLARGAYFTYSGRVPFRHLIYPVPIAGGLGTHLTLDLAGYAKFGPDVEWIDEIDYSVDPNRYDPFLRAARKIWPDIDPERLQPGYCGIRPKLSGPGEPAADFRISGPDDHGLNGLVNLFGIESPGLTSSLAIADHVVRLLQ